MANRMYWCDRCKREHRNDSQIGREHFYERSSLGRTPSWPSTLSRTGSTQRSSHSSCPTPAPSPVRTPAPRSTSVGPPPHPPLIAPSRIERRRRRSRHVLNRRTGEEVSTALLNLIFEAGSPLAIIADELLEQLPWHKRRAWSHWFCILLEHTSDAVSPGTYIAVVQKEITSLLQDKGMPRFVALSIGKSFGAVANRLVGSLGTDQIVAALRALVLLLCPDFSRCPTQEAVCAYFLKPEVEEALRTMFKTSL